MNRAQRRALARNGTPPAKAPKPIRLAARKAKEVPLHRTTILKLSMQAHWAAERIRTGLDADGYECQTLAAIANITELLCREGFGGDQLQVALSAQEAVKAIDTRAITARRFVASGPELSSINAMLELHDAQIESDDCTEAVYVACIVAATQHMKSVSNAKAF